MDNCEAEDLGFPEFIHILHHNDPYRRHGVTPPPQLPESDE